jgi:iron-sulfur cluster repair protein YtfE (RIC family)
MDYILEIFKTEHKILVNMFTNIREEAIYSNNIQSSLLVFKKFLMQHLMKEDEIIYPALLAKANKNKELTRKMNRYDKEMEKITEIILTYFSNYGEGFTRGNFIHDTNDLYEIMKTRIVYEETIIFPEYEKLTL